MMLCYAFPYVDFPPYLAQQFTYCEFHLKYVQNFMTVKMKKVTW